MLSKDPVPLVAHEILVALPPITPANVYVEPAHITSAGPALTVAMRFIVSSKLSCTATHGPTPSGSSVVKVNVTSPAAISAMPGVYVAASRAGLSKAPSPPVVQVELVADPPRAPESR